MSAVRCSKCQALQPLDPLRNGAPLPCPACRAELRVWVFPAIHRGIAPGAQPQQALFEGESTCFFHPEKKAAAVCDWCGRFLCALCDVALSGKHVCPTCLETGREKKTVTALENYRTTYPSLAATLAVLPLVFWPVTLVTAPAALFVAIYGWNKPPSLTGRRRRWVLVLAGIVALAECAGWIALGIAIYHSSTRA